MGMVCEACKSCSSTKNNNEQKNTNQNSSHNHNHNHNQKGNKSDRSSGSKCYTCNARINQRPEIGRDDFRIQINAQHHGDHTCNEQILNVIFNHPATFISCSNGSLHGGNNKSHIQVKLRYHNNPNDNIGMGDFIVKSDHKDLQIVNCYINDGH